jgi:hypothetical protein
MTFDLSDDLILTNKSYFYDLVDSGITIGRPLQQCEAFFVL